MPQILLLAYRTAQEIKLEEGGLIERTKAALHLYGAYNKENHNNAAKR